MFDRKLINYLPPVLQNVTEFETITNAQQPEIKAAWDALNLVMNNQFIDTATEAGVKLWEQEFNIIPPFSDTLEDRKLRIKAIWNQLTPYTMKCLSDNVSKICGDESNVILDGYHIKVVTHLYKYDNAKNRYDLLKDILQEIVPCNMLVICISLVSHRDLKKFSNKELSKFTHQQLKTGIPLEEVK